MYYSICSMAKYGRSAIKSRKLKISKFADFIYFLDCGYSICIPYIFIDLWTKLYFADLRLPQIQICGFAICGMAHLRNCGFNDCGISPRICRFAICGITKKILRAHLWALHEYYCILYLVIPLLPGLTNSGRVDRSLILVSQPIFRQIIAHLGWGVSHMVEAPGRILDQHGLYQPPHGGRRRMWLDGHLSSVTVEIQLACKKPLPASPLPLPPNDRQDIDYI